MDNSIIYFLRRVYRKLSGKFYEITYSQTGEDIIIDLLINAKQIKNFNYLDIGANHPTKLNNTYKFYEKGYKGVCIEPDPNLCAYLKRYRKKDKCLNIGIAGKEAAEADFFIMDNALLNTFSKAEAEKLQSQNLSVINRVSKIPLRTIDDIIKQYFDGQAPVFINIDVEGLDEEIIRTFPFHKHRPYIFCIETVHYTSDASSEKREDIIQIMRENNYKIFADTYINTIFIDSRQFLE